MLNAGLANTPLINYFCYNISTFISTSADGTCFPILSVADGGNGQLLITTNDTSVLSFGVAITISGTTSYNGNYTVLSLTPTTFNVSGVFGVTETGNWELAANITSSNAGDPLDFGTITFFDQDDKVTLQDTFSDRNLTIPNTNPITLDAVGSFPPIYMLEEAYFIIIRDKFNNLVATLDDYLPIPDVSAASTELPLGNLFPNYGFETKVNETIFSETSLPANSTTAVSAGAFWEIVTTETNPNNTYDYLELGASGLLGNPRNELQLRSTNNSSGQSINNYFMILGAYNMFQDVQLQLSIFTRLISGSPTTIPVQLVRTKNGVAETPINVGSINIDVTRTQETLTFTVPDLTTADYDNNDVLRLVLNLPLNVDFQHGYTGTWAQLSPGGSLNITEQSISTSAAQQLFGSGQDSLGSDTQFEMRGLPIAMGEASFFPLNMTGEVFTGGENVTAYDEFSASMLPELDEGQGVELVRNEVIGQTQTNRLIDYLRTHNLTQSTLSFIATSAINVVSVETGIGTEENSTWQTSAGPRITVSKTTDELTFKLSAKTTGNGRVVFTFVDQFAASTNPFNPTYSGGGGLVYSTPPASGPMINWIGSSDFISPSITAIRFVNFVSSFTINNGSPTENASAQFRFVGNYAFPHKTDDALDNSGAPNRVNSLIQTTGECYQGFTGGVKERISPGGTFLSSQIQSGFISYNDSANNPATQPVQPSRVINFGPLDGSTARTGVDSTLTIILTKSDTAPQIARKVSEGVNTSFIEDITIVSTPTNGDVVEMSNSTTDFNLIFFDTALTKPTNPSTVRKPIFVEYTTGQTTTQIATSTASAINLGVMGVPRAADLGFTFPTGNQFYMFL